MKFLPLIDLQLKHDYYTDGRCPDFRIEPTEATQRLLKNHRCVLKTFPTGIQILMAVADDNTQFIPLSKDAVFAFNLRLHNPDFALFTDLTEITPIEAPFYTNADLQPFDHQKLTLASRCASSIEEFLVQAPAKPAEEVKFTLHGQPWWPPLLGTQEPGDSRLATFSVRGYKIVDGKDFAPPTPIEMKPDKPSHYDEPTKVITLDSQTADLISITYPVRPPKESDVFAGVEIHCSDFVPKNADAPIARVCEIHFKAKKARWKYYLIADPSKAPFQIQDSSKELEFSEPTEVSPKTGENDDSTEITTDTAIALIAQDLKKQLWRFDSNPIPCRQAARAGLQLLVKGQKIEGVLPNPALSNYALEEPRNETVSLFQVVKHFTH